MLLKMLGDYFVGRGERHPLASPERHASYKWETLDPRARAAPGMTTHHERRYLQWYARTAYTGKGAILDLGSWLGSSLVPLLVGKGENPNVADSPPIYAYDSFIYRDWMSQFEVKGKPLGEQLESGDSLLPIFNEIISEFPQDSVVVRAGDFNQELWSDGPIEMLFVDVMKTWELANHIVKNYFPSLVPGESFVAHQDYRHYYTPWIHVIMYRLRESFKPVISVRESGTTVFQVIKPIPELPELNYSDFNDEELEAAFAHSRTVTTEHSRVTAAHVQWFTKQGDYGRAREIANKVLKQYGDSDELKLARQSLEESEKANA